jgi:hypothetical protein
MPALPLHPKLAEERMRPVNFSHIEEHDFHTSETIRIEFKTDNVRKFNSWLLYVYHALCAFLVCLTFYALAHISTINPERFWMLLGVDVVAFGVASLLWVGRR